MFKLLTVGLSLATSLFNHFEQAGIPPQHVVLVNLYIIERKYILSCTKCLFQINV